MTIATVDMTYLGIPEVDSEHEALFRHFSVLKRAVEREQFDRLSMIMLALNNYVSHHFDHEEAHMVDAGYPDLHQHQQQHAALYEELRGFDEAFKHLSSNATRKSLGMALFYFLEG
ncbi:bacteriohemerythrin [Magnetofaba australis]|uniref:Putative hemerythrin-like metal-binding protein n=1 Tax=Magnetofaba australis IT-1 TaxID=1434232 RepID=A0A1Y2K9W3_9PROT|nr:hemerythrin domain-containing protein [Magnetofaba australis]OSM08456.1 putative hemerythrin-like metal-binding protein [Magnetofaba australis IT-1]